MFFGKKNSLEAWLREEHAEDMEGWDGHSMAVHAVRTKAQVPNDMMCVVLMNANRVLHKVFVIDPQSGQSLKGEEELARKFLSEYVPDMRHFT